MLKLSLSSSKSSWQAPAQHGDKKWDEVIHAAVSRKYQHTCQYCGWKDDVFNEVSHLNEDHHNHQEENLVLACPLCHQCLHLSKVAIAEGGKLIWAPGVSQVEINHLVRMYWVLEEGARHAVNGSQELKQINEVLTQARLLVNKLEHQSHVLEAHFVAGGSDPGLLAETLLKMTPEQYTRRDDYLKNIRIWPNVVRFRRMVPHWLNQTKVNLPLQDWMKLASQVQEGAKE
jgi:hypothetical protein